MRLSILTSIILISAAELFGQTVNPVLWERRTGPVGGSIHDIEYDAATGNYYALVGERRRLFYSQNDGDNWEEYTSTPGTFNYFNDIEITNNTIYLTTSYGVWSSPSVDQNWSQITSDFFDFSNANKIKRLSNGRLVVLANAGIFYSINNGVDWTEVNLTGSLNGGYLAKSTADQLFIIKDQKVFRSNDLGANFTEFSTSLPGGYQAHGIWANNDGSNIYCVTGENIYISDGTNAWSSIKGGSISEATISSISTDASVLEFSDDGLGMYFIDNVNHKLHSKLLNGAASSWIQRQTSFPTASSTILNAACKDFPSTPPTTSNVLFGTRTGVLRTTNGGTTYSEINTNLSGVDAETMITDLSGGGSGVLLMVSNNQNTLLKSANQGSTWSVVTGYSGQIYEITQNPSRTTIYLVTSAGAYRSTNGGTNWTSITLPGSLVPQKFLPADNNKVFAVYGNAFYYSSNQGTSWTNPTISNLPGGSGYSLTTNHIMCANTNRMILRLYDYNTSTYKSYRVQFTYSGATLTGSAATQITVPFDQNDISETFAFNGNFYLFNPYTSPDQLAISTDGGANWVTRNLDSGNDVFITPNGYIFYAGSSNEYEVYISRDNGATFQLTTFDEDPKPNTYDIEAVAIDYDGNAYLAVDGDFVYRSKKIIVLPDGIPDDLVEVGRSATAISLRWDDNSSNEDNFEIFHSTNGVDFVKSGEADDFCFTPNDRDFFVVTGLQPNTNYTFRVRAENAAGTTTPAQILASTLNTCAASIPDNRSWNAVNAGGSGGYPVVSPAKVVNIRHMGGGKYEVSDMSLRLIDTSDDDPGTFYESCGETFVISSDDVNSNGNGTWNGTNTLTLKWRQCGADKVETITFTLRSDDPAPDAPSIRAYNLSNNSIEVNWQLGAYQKTYIVERSTNTPTAFSEVGRVDYPAKKFIDNTGLVAGTTYHYRVKAANGNTSPIESTYSGNASIVFNAPKFVVPDNGMTSHVAVTLGSYWADFNNDGFDDYFTLSFDPVAEKGSPVIFRNTGTDFVETTPVGLMLGEAYFATTIIDYDNDGNLDIAFSGQDQVVFDVYKGNGDFTFTKVTSSLGGLSTIISEDGEIASMSWADFDNDGLLDLIVLTRPSSGSGGKILVYHQNANHTFTKIDAGQDMEDDNLQADGATWADYDNDGFQDVLILNSEAALRLYKNNGDNTFTKQTAVGLSASEANTAVWGDYNNDGHIDLYVGVNDENVLFKNDGDGTFTMDGSTSISEPSTNISSSWGDFNNDGYLDLITAAFLSGQTRFFLRDASSPGTITFNKHISEKINDLNVSHFGVSTTDYDNDGRLDVALSGFEFTETSDGVSAVNTNLFKNNTSTGNWSEVKLAPTSGNKGGVGATIKLTAGGITQMRQIQAVATYVSKNSATAHFGIGAATTINNIQVTWVNGDVQNYPNPPRNQILTIDQDNVAPDVSGFTPSNNAVNVSTNTSITISLDEASSAVAGKMLLLYLHNNLSAPIDGIDVSDAVKSGNMYTFTFSAPLQGGTQYNISLDAGAFVDKYLNGTEELPTGNWTFTTASGPVATGLSPASTSANIAANTEIQMTFDKNISAVAGKHLKIMDGTNTVEDIDVSLTGAVTNTVYKFTPATKLPTNKVLKVLVDAGAFKDAATQADFAGIAADAWTFTIAQGPVASAFSPANNATNVAVNTGLQITFDKNITAVSGKKVKVMDGTTAVFDGDVATGTITDNVFSITPPTALPTDKLLNVIVDENAFVAIDKQTDFAGIVTGTWSFRTVLPADATAPVMTFVPPLTAAKGFNNLVSPQITVTDDRGTVSSVVVTIKKLTGAASTAVDVAAVQGSGADSDKWVFSISEANHFDAIGTEYFITAKDPTNNTVRSPATGTHKLYLTYTANESKIPSDKLGFGGAVSNWKVFSIPFALGSNNSVTAIFNELEGKTNKVDYRFLTIQSPGNTDWTEYPSFSTINRGQGYFSNIKTPIDILLGPLQAPENSRTNLFTINLKAGWNMVGNPYLTQISWADVKTYNSLTGQVAELHKFNGSTYPVGVQTLDAYEGGFIFAQADQTVTIPFLNQTASGGRSGYQTLSEDINNTEWLLQLNLQQGIAINDLGSIGMAPDAKLSLDDYDGVTPPRFIEFLEMNFAHPEHFAKRFSRDVVPTLNEYTWSFTVDSNLEGEAEIFWNNNAFQHGAKEIFLFDESRQRLIDMRAVSRYAFNPKESANFKVYFGENLKIAPQTVLLGKAFPNPTSGFTNIAFSLPDSGGQNQFVTLDILDATGKNVGTIAQGRYQPGFYETGFNSRELNNGFYTYRLTVQSSRGTNTLVSKLIIK